MKIRRSVLVTGVLAALAGLTFVVAGYASTKAPLKKAPLKKAPINVGAVGSLTGPVPFPEASAAAKAVFDRVNAQGGINGRLIKYLVEDDKADPALAAQGARRLVDQQGVVAMVGSASLLECAVNGAFYTEKNVLSIQGTGVDPVCFGSPNISPVNTGPYRGTTVNLYFASEVLKRAKVCMIYFNVPGLEKATQQAADSWSKLTGKKLAFFDTSLALTDDPTPLALKAKQEGCQAVVINGLESHVIAWMKAVKTQGITGIDWIALTSGYTQGVATELGKAGAENGLYANAEFEPYLGASPVLADWRSLMAKAKVPQTSFAEGGYLAATIFVDALKGIKGEITRASVTAALHGIKNYKSALIGTPYRFLPGPAHSSNRASKMVQLKGGKWQPVSPSWLILPGK